MHTYYIIILYTCWTQNKLVSTQSFIDETTPTKIRNFFKKKKSYKNKTDTILWFNALLFKNVSRVI